MRTIWLHSHFASEFSSIICCHTKLLFISFIWIIGLSILKGNFSYFVSQHRLTLIWKTVYCKQNKIFKKILIKNISIDLSSVSSSLTSYDKDFHKKLRKKVKQFGEKKKKKKRWKNLGWEKMSDRQTNRDSSWHIRPKSRVKSSLNLLHSTKNNLIICSFSFSTRYLLNMVSNIESSKGNRIF